ncbi:hypothetical protein RHSIM_Rhsim11G0198300 [Rhododendron simsii]|uniref:DYW domain-containing protein n=1 Tax=Rhododendron simsii TaxID=118357 RepID=A0A834G7I2_RHOSS|nr:hypothetical protein RHSIM_Rhsim11G0198300 [Rhododendron simsii]
MPGWLFGDLERILPIQAQAQAQSHQNKTKQKSQVIDHTVPVSNVASLGSSSSGRLKWKRKLDLSDYFKFWSIVTLALTVLTSSQAILIVWSKRAGKYEYSVTTANFLVEALKCALSLAGLVRIWRSEGVTDDNRLGTTVDEVSVYPIPAALYLIKNLLQYYIFAYVDAPGYQILKNLNIITTGVLYLIILKKNSDRVLQTPFQGWVMAIVMALLSGFAGVYTEAIIKKCPSRNINVQNFWLYVFGMGFNAIAILIQDFDAVMNKGFFHGYSLITTLMIINHALSGIAVSMVMNYADNIVKVYSTSVAMLLTAVVSVFLFGFHISLPFFLGSTSPTDEYRSNATSNSSPLAGVKIIIEEFTKFCYQRDLPRAMNALDSMQNHNLWADSVTYSELLKCCLSRSAIHQARLVHKHLFSRGHQPKTFLVNILLNVYLKFNLLDEAQALFDQMTDRNVVSWTTMIAAYTNAMLNDKALEFLILMLRDGVRPNMFTYSSVLGACHGLPNLRQLHSCIIKAGLDSDVFVRSALIDIYSKWGESHNAHHIFDEMVTGDAIVWNSIIGSFAQNTDGHEALNLFKRMKQAGFWADQATLTSVLRACTGLALLELGRQAHVHVIKFKQDLILNNALLDMYCKCGSLEDANSTFTRMVNKDVISWSTMITGFAQNGFSRGALELFELMKASGTKPNYITIVGVLFACSHAGLVEDGQYYFRSMKTCFGIDPGREHYGCMVDLLGRAGKLDEAVKLINQMEYEPDAVTWRALLGACRVHRDTDLAIYSAKKILNLEPNNAGTYILLSNIYANSQRWEDVAVLRTTMRDRGVRKEPGCSWIEVNKQIHAFIIGDNSHPQIQAISTELNQLIWKLKELGYVPQTDFVLQDVEGEQKEDSLSYHSEKLAIVFGMMSLQRETTIRIRKNLRICGDCHVFAKLVANIEHRNIVIRDPIRYHHFSNGVCSCGDYW